MRSTLLTTSGAALLLSSAAALLAQPALAHEQHMVVQAPAAVYVRNDHGWQQGWRRDDSPPVITDLTPQPGAAMTNRRSTMVSATFTDAFSSIDPGSVRLRLDGRDVTGYAQVDPLHVRLVSDLAPGRHFAEVIVRDRAGNAARQSWQFDVQGTYGEGYGRESYGRYGWRR